MDISRLQIDQSKMLASGEEYFKLFEKHLPTGLDSSKTVLVYEISNLSCVKKIVNLNPEAKYIVVGSKACNRALKMVLPKAIDVEYLEEFDFKETDMKFDCIIMNPPYDKTLHIKILDEALKHIAEDGICVNLSPCPLLTSIRNIYDENAIAKRQKVKSYQRLRCLDKIDNGIDIFNAGIQQHLGIQVYSLNEDHSFSLTDVIDADVPHSLVKKIMHKCMKMSVLNVKMDGEFELPLSGIHGHIGCKDFLNIMSMTYEAQLKSAGKYVLKFKTEDDRHAFYDFWMSPLGKFVTSLWKVDTHVMLKYIPYAWFRTKDAFIEYFDITPEEQKVIEETMEKYK